MQLSGARTKREVVNRALRELVARATRPSVRELFGIGGVPADYDPKAPWASGSYAMQGRIEHSVHEPATSYRATLKKRPPAAGQEGLMLLVDSSVWIDWLRGAATKAVRFNQAREPFEEIVLTQMIYLEVLQGVSSDCPPIR